MSDSLPADMSAYIESKIASGAFSSESELTLEALRLYREMEHRHHSLKVELEHRIAESDGGKSQVMDIEAIKLELQSEIAQSDD